MRWPGRADVRRSRLVGLEDPPRAEVPAALERCRQAGINVVMVTGDHPETASAIARAIGLVRSDATCSWARWKRRRR